MRTEGSTTQRPGEGRVPESRQPSVAIHTQGCKLNQADSLSLTRQFREAGYRVVESTADADVIVLNSCTVTSTADSKARQFLRAANRLNPDAVLVATGCYAQRAPTDLEGMAQVSLVVGNTGKPGLVEEASAKLQATRELSQHSSPAQPQTAGRTRAMVKIQEGCDQVCAYCIVPKVRGRERSLPPEDIVDEINRFGGEGYREVALTGTQLGTYGFDMEAMSLAGLMEQILAETSVERIRVSSLQAHEITSALLELWTDSRLMPHFHIPLQSGCDGTLKAMRRRYDTARFAESVDRVREMHPDAGITTDIIVGFPGETEEDFLRSIEFASAMKFSDIHAFPYSRRPGTSAVYLDGQVAETEKRSRMGEMLELSKETQRKFRESQLGTVRSVLWERSSGRNQDGWMGLTDNYIRVRAAAQSDLGNTITGARLTGIDGILVHSEVVE